MDHEFEKRLARCADETQRLLEKLLDAQLRAGEIARPERLLAAMRHGALNGGKRLRPFLVMESAALFGAKPAASLRIAAALECIHCYSLIHDDLPAMDDDDLRRGQPTVHRAFDEATAILAGDSLLTYAFDIIADDETALSAKARLTLVALLARAAGLGGMAGGQMLDLDAAASAPGEQQIITLQAMKTGALIRFACEAGPVIAGAPEADRERLAEFGSAIGLAFQLADDLLDVTSTTEKLGKATDKDATAGKATLVALHGADWARRQLDGLVGQATALLAPYGSAALHLTQAATFVATRET
ncbi:polyprenyl synthetase family protein [Mesorhizobium sp. Z1-4]|uniref:polyprenyl synthetase family protein n=1 Tax=Mesorhizobium sp. Z1-4 TaxID=2448478 RepID=UPI000FD99B06|nr:farnesyl diphosphate synthase [Mesorhizobium sp. Z1-4]